MKKDKEWLKQQVKTQGIIMDKPFIYITDVMKLINQLDEPEITEEQAWNKIAESYPADAKSLAVSFQHFYYEGVACAENERTTQLVEIPQFAAETIEKYKENNNSLGELLSSVEHANIKYYHGMEKYRGNFNNLYPQIVDLCATIARAWLDGYAISPPKTLQVIVKNYDSTVCKTELPEDEAIKLIEGWKEDEKS